MSKSATKKAQRTIRPTATDELVQGMNTSPQSTVVRRKIEMLSTTLSLPTIRRALGVLEGEHPSARGGGSADPLSTRDYTSQDEARLIDWKLSARSGKPMVTERERLVTSRIWLMLDTGAQMNATSPSGERAWEVASNALCMFAALSCRRHDAISLVLADNEAIIRVPGKGGLANFEHLLDAGLTRTLKTSGNLEALLNFAASHAGNGSMIVLATNECSLKERHIEALRTIALRHPLVVVSIATLNPFNTANHGTIVDVHSGRRIPAFMKDRRATNEVNTHREYMAALVDKELRGFNASMLKASGSQEMFDNFVSLVSTLSQRNLGSSTPMPVLDANDGDAA